MDSLSSLDILAILSELKDWEGSRVNKVSQDGPELRFELFKRPFSGETGEKSVDGKCDRRVRLVVHAGERIHLTSFPKPYPPAKGFCMLLRKYAEGGVLKTIEQHGFDRVVVLTFEKRQAVTHLVAELFAKGNLIFCDSAFKIIQPWKVEFWKGRSLKPRAEYKFPPSGPDLNAITKEEFSQKLNASVRGLAATLAKDIGLGRYADEACGRAGIAKDKPASALTEKELQALLSSVQALLSAAGEPEPHKAGEEVYPFKMKSVECRPVQSSFNAAVDAVFSEGDASEAQTAAEVQREEKAERASAWHGQLQEKAAELDAKAAEAEAAAGQLHSHSAELASLLEKIRTAKKEGRSWEQIEKDFGVSVKKNEGKIIVEVG